MRQLVYTVAVPEPGSLAREESREHEMIIVGVVAIAEGENPRVIESRLQGLVY